MAAIKVIDFPHVNPVKFVRATNALDLFFEQKIPFFETQVQYYQKFQTSDYIQFQINVDVTRVDKYGLIVQLRSCADNVNYGNFVRVGDVFTFGTLNNMTFRLNLYNPTIPEGDYYVYVYAPYLNSSIFDLFYSEPLDIQTTHQGTIRIDYTNDGNDFNAFFYENHNYTSLRYFSYRVDGGFRSDGFQPSSNDNSFLDQTANAVLLSSTPYDVQKLTFGSNKGIPNYQISMINHILSCSAWAVDGIQFCKVEGAKLERKPLAPNHPLFYWQIDVQAALNDYSDVHYFKFPRPTVIGIGTMAIGSTFIISPNINDMSITQSPIMNGAFKPSKPIPVPHIPAGVEVAILHNLDMPRVMWRFRDTTNRTLPQFSIEEIDTSNPRNALIVRSEVEIPAGQLLLDIIGYYEF